MSKSFKRYDILAAARFGSHEHVNGKSETLKGVKSSIQNFGENILSTSVLKERLPKTIWKGFKSILDGGNPLSLEIADAVAAVMKDWAIEKGATHYCHWFQPLTGSTAEKHDSFIMPSSDEDYIAEFTGKDLIQGEPDASSFPSGGLRATFEARGYTAWDPSSPAFIVESHCGSVLCIPSVFVSWKGEALDTKTPLLRSDFAIQTAALKSMKLFGEHDVKKVFSTVGFELEYFLIDEEFYYRRPDLMTCGRTLVGAKPPRGQELDDHYFGTIPERVHAFMMDVEKELYKLGVPIKTHHNEVAPAQYEIAPVFETVNIAADHQQLTMSVLQKKAHQYGLVCLLHEKPFSGINGSGKHSNWSLATDTGINLLEPTDNPHENKIFLYFTTAVIKAVYEHQDLLRIACASAGNDHRLGANEAPPAIMSIFLGDLLDDVFQQVIADKPKSSKKKGLFGLGIPVVPFIAKHAGDRNRTSPFAFTGNKFEFRAVGSSFSVSFPITVLNSIVADVLNELNAELEASLKSDLSLDESLLFVMKKALKESYIVVFNGDGYAGEWQKEAEKRGLLNCKNTLEALRLMISEKNSSLFERLGVLNKEEFEARYEIMLEQYFKTVNIEAETSQTLAKTMILPAAIRYFNELAAVVDRGTSIGLNPLGASIVINEINELTNELVEKLQTLVKVNADLGGDTISEKCDHIYENVIPAMKEVRIVADHLERALPDDYWPLPTYREMLFVK